jgi:hypothetical protein
MAITSLFGPTPAQIEQARQLQMDQQISGEGAELGPFRGLYQASRRLGSAGTQSLVSGLFPEAADPAMRQAQAVQLVQQKYQGQNLSDPSVLKNIASDLFSAGAPDAGLRILKTAQDLTPKQESVAVAPGGTLVDKRTGRVLFEAADREQMVKTPADFAAAGRELGFGVRPNIGDYTQQETQAINNLLERRGIRRAEAGVPKSGEVKITDLNTATQLVDRFVKAPQEKLSTARDARSQLILARRGEGAAFAQLQRQLVKLVGDSQIGMGEVRDALGSAGIVGNTISAVNQFMTGVPSADKLDSVEQVINALEDINAQSYNSGRKRAESVLNEANLSEGTRKSLIPPAYKTGREKKTGGFVEGKVYKDANGNRARYVKGKWEPVQ